MSTYSDGNALRRLKKLLKGVFILLGAIFLIFVVMALFTWNNSSGFLEEHQEFVTKFSKDLATNWSPEDVYPRLSNEFASSLNDPKTLAAFTHLKGLGELVDTSDFTMHKYMSGTDGVTGIITFKATYEYAKALVTITLKRTNEKVLVYSLRIDPVGEYPVNTNQKT